MTVKIDTDAEINSIRVKEVSPPAAPASGYGQIYAKTDGRIYFKNDAGAEYDLTATGSAGGSGIPNDGWISAGVTWVYASADDPSFVFDISGNYTGTYATGQRIKLTQTTVKYFLVTNVAYSSGTTTSITVYGGTNYDLANAEITSPYYSPVKSPYGFPLDPSLWTVQTWSSGSSIQSNPTQDTWYNLGTLSITIPIGIWRVSYQVDLFAGDTTADVRVYSTLSTANNSESDADFTTYNGGTTTDFAVAIHREKQLSLASKTVYYLNEKTNRATQDAIQLLGEISPTIIRAVSSYL